MAMGCFQPVLLYVCPLTRNARSRFASKHSDPQPLPLSIGFIDQSILFPLYLQDIEEDLARGTSLYVPRVMHRLLYTMSQDRKLS